MRPFGLYTFLDQIIRGADCVSCTKAYITAVGMLMNEAKLIYHDVPGDQLKP